MNNPGLGPSRNRPGPRVFPAIVGLVVFVAGVRLPGQNVFSGVWGPGTDAHAAWITSNWTEFLGKWDEFAGNGLRMHEFETYLDGSQRVYSGLFRAGTDDHASWFTSDWNDFTSKWDTFARLNLRMHDFETYVEGGVRFYAGIFRQGTDAHAACILADWNEFTKKWDELGGNGLRMHDFETYFEDGTRFYAGIFRQGNDAHAAHFTADWDDFTSVWANLEGQGLRLLDFEFYDDAGTWTYGGIFRAGSGGGYSWFGVDWENFRSFWHERDKESFRLNDLEVFPGSCSNVCANQLILPPPDYYDYGVTRTATHCPGLPGSCTVPGNDVFYRSPWYEEDGQRFVRLSAVNIEHQIFTLPFTDAGMWHNGWLYSPGSWHMAIDYLNGANFNVRAAAPGRVIHIGWDWWSGGTVVVSHDVPGDVDRYRTIYMHLLNGAEPDCARAWSETVPLLSSPTLEEYQTYLANTNCNENGSGTPDSTHWGTNSDVIDMSLLGEVVQRGEVLGKAGSTGPGGCGCIPSGSGPNHHLHIFFAHRDPTDDRWYLFDPYGIYGPRECYPSRDDASAGPFATSCARYPVAWLGGTPQIPPPPGTLKFFKRGDSNDDGVLDISDAIFALGCQFLGTECPGCMDSADSNDDGEVDLSDAIYVLNCVFIRFCPPLAGASCAPDPTPTDPIGCESYSQCTGVR